MLKSFGVVLVLGCVLLSSCDSSHEHLDVNHTSIEIFYPSGKIKGNGFKDRRGLKQGIFSWFFENGKDSLIQNFKDDQLNGESSYYYITGGIQQVENYCFGKKNGAVSFYNNGMVTSKQFFEDDINTVDEFYENGFCISKRALLIDEGSFHSFVKLNFDGEVDTLNSRYPICHWNNNVLNIELIGQPYDDEIVVEIIDDFDKGFGVLRKFTFSNSRELNFEIQKSDVSFGRINILITAFKKISKFESMAEEYKLQLRYKKDPPEYNMIGIYPNGDV